MTIRSLINLLERYEREYGDLYVEGIDGCLFDETDIAVLTEKEEPAEERSEAYSIRWTR